MEIKPNLLSFSFKGKTPAKTYKTILDVQDEQLKANPLDEHRKKRMADMKSALTKLQELKENSSPKKLASQRAGILKQRLEALKAILEKLPPGNYKALAQELKQIAKQLNVISKSVGGSAGGGSSMPVMSVNSDNDSTDSSSEEGLDVNPESAVSAAPDTSSPNTSAPDTSASDAKEAEKLAKEVERQVHSEAKPEENAKVDEQDESKLDKPSSSTSPLASLHANDDIDDRALREILTEAGKLVRQVLSLLKAKHQDDDEETRELFKDIKSELEGLDKNLGEGSLATTGQALGVNLGESLSMASISSLGGMGGFVDVSV